MVLDTALVAALVAIEQTHLSQLHQEQAIPLPLVAAAQQEPLTANGVIMARIPFLAPSHLLAAVVVVLVMEAT